MATSYIVEYKMNTITKLLSICLDQILEFFLEKITIKNTPH